MTSAYYYPNAVPNTVEHDRKVCLIIASEIWGVSIEDMSNDRFKSVQARNFCMWYLNRQTKYPLWKCAQMFNMEYHTARDVVYAMDEIVLDGSLKNVVWAMKILNG